MKTRILHYLIIVSLTLVSGCDVFDSENPYKIIINGEVNYFDNVHINIEGSTDRPQNRTLKFMFEQNSEQNFNSFGFEFKEPDYEVDKLLKRGTHTPSQSELINGLKPATYSIPVDKGKITIHWTKVHNEDDVISGNGYIEIESRIEFNCADSFIGSHGKIVKPGELEYEDYFENYCSPPDYYVTQKIRF